MGDDVLLDELKQILAACIDKSIPVFVVGAFSLRAYDCLFRSSVDLDLAITAEEWPKLRQLLESRGYAVAPEQVWITAIKPADDGQIEINIALNGITDLDSATIYPLDPHRPELHQPADLDFALPVLPFESVLITKMIALREKDIADLLNALLQRGSDVQPERFWRFAIVAEVDRQLQERLLEMIDQLHGGDAISIWYERTGAILTDPERDLAISIIQRLLKSKPK